MRAPVLLLSLSLLLLSQPLLAAEKKEGEKDDQKNPVHKITQAESYLMLEPIYTSIVENNRPAGLMMIGVGIDIPDARLRAQAEHAMPVLRDAFVRNMMAFSVSNVRSWRQPDVVVIASRLQAVTDRALGRKGARVLLNGVALLPRK